MNFFPISTMPITGTNFSKGNKKVREIFRDLEKKTKRKSYIRTPYFDKEKIFFDYFFPHLNQKSRKTKLDRLKFFPCALELIQKTRYEPSVRVNLHGNNETLYRFGGITPNEKKFLVQIKEKKKGNKFLMSVFEETKKIS